MTARTIAQSAVSAVSIYMRQVYMWMTAGLAITAVTAFAVASSPDLQMAILGNMVIMIALIVAQFGMVIALGAAIHKMSATTATAVFIAYSALTGLTLSVHRQHLPGQQHDGLRHQLHRRADLHRPHRL